MPLYNQIKEGEGGIILLKFEWDNVKETKNIAKHGIDFDMASRIFADPFRIEFFDSSHSFDEDRYITIGEINGEVILLTVVYTEREETIRLISARKATARERRVYHDSRERD